MQSLFALVLCLAGTAVYARTLDQSYALQSWLVWDLATLWAWAALFVLGCLSTGLRMKKLLAVPGDALAERAVLAMAGGVTAFALGMYALGAARLFRAEAAVVLILAMLAFGWRELREFVSRFFHDALTSVSRSPTATLASALGGICVLLVYFGVLTPDALNYDATWVHVSIAQDYARLGYLAPFYADYTRNVPHLASLIYTWAYLVPGLVTPLRWMLVLHLEFVMFVWTLVGISAGVTWLLGDKRARGAWAAFFLFPIIFVYDSNLGGAADHVLAFFAMPLLLTFRWVLDRFAPGPSYYLAILAGGAALTKYQALYLLLPLAVVLAVRWGTLVRQALLARRTGKHHGSDLIVLGSTPAIMVGLFLVVFAPHLAKNFYYYENPFYPFMSQVFDHTTPTVPNAALYVDHVFKDQRWVPPGGVLDKAAHAARLFFTFSFTPHYSFTRGWPVFGPLFTLLLPALVVVRERRILLAAGTASMALFVWAYTFNVDRNLQIFLPYLVCVTAALLARLWGMGILARVGVGVLVGFQVVSSADAVFYTAQANFQSTMHLLASGFEGRPATRYAGFRATHRAIGDALPKDARVLLHTHHPSLGINREIILDWTGHQGLVSYAHVSTVRDLVQYYHSLGVTHVLYVPGEWPAPSRKEEVLFDGFTRNYATDVRTFAPYRLLAVPAQPPPKRSPMTVATLGMPGYSDGLYSVDQMDVNENIPVQLRVYPPPKQIATTNAEREVVLRAADAALVGAGRAMTPQETSLLATFQRIRSYAGLFTVYMKRNAPAIESLPAPSVGKPGVGHAGARSAPSR